MFTQTTYPNKKSNLNCKSIVTIPIYPITLFQIVSANKREQEEKKRKFFFDRNHLLNLSIKLYDKKNNPNETPSSYPVNYYSRNSYDLEKRSSSRNRSFPCFFEWIYFYGDQLKHLISLLLSWYRKQMQSNSTLLNIYWASKPTKKL